jgi:hypothetical protein
MTCAVQTGSTIYIFHDAIAEVATSETEWSQNVFCMQ